MQIIGGGQYDTYDGKYIDVYIDDTFYPSRYSIKMVDTPTYSWHFVSNINIDGFDYAFNTNAVDFGSGELCILGTTYDYHTFSANTASRVQFVSHLWEPIETDDHVDNGDHSGYYDSYVNRLNNLTGNNLMTELNHLMLDTHFSLIKYSDFANYTKENISNPVSIDRVSESVGLNELIYTGKQVSFSTSFTREHLWPCASSRGLWVHSNYTDIKYYVDDVNYVGGGSDLYHVRPCTSSVNTARGSARYKEFTDVEKASAYSIGDGGPDYLLCDSSEFAQYCEPSDSMKGDIARILMYVYVHYKLFSSYYWEGYQADLQLTDVVKANTEAEALNLLIKWNMLDPVSETEQLRNDTVQKIQGNRNPFVDYPFLLNNCASI